MKRLILMAMFSMIFAASAAAAEGVSIRLVEASNSGNEVSSGLRDVVSILKTSLAFSSYTIRASGSLPLPSDNASVSLDGYSVTCRGTQAQLSITIKKGKTVVLHTKAALKSGSPLVLGGFPSGDNKLVFILVAQ